MATSMIWSRYRLRRMGSGDARRILRCRELFAVESFFGVQNCLQDIGSMDGLGINSTPISINACSA